MVLCVIEEKVRVVNRWTHAAVCLPLEHETAEQSALTHAEGHVDCQDLVRIPKLRACFSETKRSNSAQEAASGFIQVPDKLQHPCARIKNTTFC